MVYTLGFQKKYEELLARSETAGKPLLKVGRNTTYQGGSVWQKSEEVEAYIVANAERLQGYGVYGVEADWVNDTAPNAQHPFHDLLVDAPLVRLP